MTPPRSQHNTLMNHVAQGPNANGQYVGQPSYTITIPLHLKDLTFQTNETTKATILSTFEDVLMDSRFMHKLCHNPKNQELSITNQNRGAKF